MIKFYSYSYFLFLTLLFVSVPAAGQSFNPSGLVGESVVNPTSLQFGPNGKLYVSQQNGTILINKNFSKEHYLKLFLTAVSRTTQHLKERRNSNFTGQMLIQQTTTASKYFSKWIEAKNKLL